MPGDKLKRHYTVWQQRQQSSKKINHVKAYAALARTPEVCTYGCSAGTGLSAAGVQIKAFASHYPGWETSVRAGMSG